MRILYALNTFRPHIDGVSISIERQAIGLAARGHEIAIVAPSPRFASSVETTADYRLYRVQAMPIDGARHRVPILPGRGARWALSDFQPDTVVVSVPFLLSRAVCQIAHAQRYPLVGITSMMPEWFYYNFLPCRPLARILNHGLWRLITGYYNRCDHVVGVTSTALKFLTDHGLRRPASVISNGVSLQVFAPRGRDEELARRLGIPRKPTVLYVGRLDAEKCMRVWVSAIPRILERVDAHFIIGGEGTERGPLEQLVDRLGIASRVSFIGFLREEEYPAVFSLADVFAISSPVELQSIVTLEAAASGLPIVAARAGALPELVHDGENGRLFAAADPAAMAEAIVELLRDPVRRKALGGGARRAATRHDFALTLEGYERLFERIGRIATLVPKRAAPAIG
ncbi:MAG: glycosyltransferase [Chloroflexota bacterium]